MHHSIRHADVSSAKSSIRMKVCRKARQLSRWPNALRPPVQVVKLCRTHRLYSALTYVLTRGLGDYIAPAVELLLALAIAPSGAADADVDAVGSVQTEPVASAGQRAAGFKLLVYLRCCLRQQQFPPGAGPLPTSKAGVIKAGVLGAWVPCSAVHHAVCVSQGLAAVAAGHTRTKLVTSAF
jgi:Golgi CORVET complex core vacuolar protein 8